MSDWTDLMHDTVTIELASGSDGAGNLTFGSPASYTGRLVDGESGIRGLEGTERVKRPRFIADGYINVRIDSRITLPDGTKPPISDVRHYPDEAGQDWTVIVL